MMEFGARLSLKDNMYATLQKNLNQQKKFQEQVKSTREHLGKLAKQKVNPIIKVKDKSKTQYNKVRNRLKLINKTIAKPFIVVKDKTSKTISKVKSKIKLLGRMVATPFIKVKNSKAIRGIGKVHQKLKQVGRFVAKPIIKLKDGASKALKGMGSMLVKLAKGVTIAVGLVGAGATILLGGALKSGAMLEQQQISIEHFIGVNNKGAKPEDIKGMADDYVKSLRENANLTPFTTNEVISAGTRAVNIAGGDTNSAMGLLKVAEDMAALNPEKSLSDAIEALADMKNGETERMKEFGFKISADDIKKAGGTDAIIKNQLAPYFEGGAKKLSGSATGLVSTIKGKIGNAISNTGLAMIEKSKPLLEKMVVLVDKMAPKMQRMGEVIAEGFGNAVEWASELVDNTGGIAPIFSEIKDVVKTTFSLITPLIKNLAPLVVQVVQIILPVFNTIGQTVARVFPLVSQTISRAMTLAMPFIEKFAGLIKRAMPIVQTIITIFCNTVNALMPIVSTIFEGVADKVGVVIDFISSKMGFIQEVFDFVVPLVTEILTVAWDIISPILDIMITVFEALWEVIEFVFPAIQAVIETVWGVLEPIFSAIAEAMTWVGDAVSSIIGWFGDVFHGVFDAPAEGAVASSSSSAPSKAVGVNRVPRDNYLINAHQGEMLLNRVEADRYQKEKNTRGVPYNPIEIDIKPVDIDPSNFDPKPTPKPVNGGGGITVKVEFNNAVIEKDANVDEMVAKMMSKFNKLVPNMG